MGVAGRSKQHPHLEAVREGKVGYCGWKPPQHRNTTACVRAASPLYPFRKGIASWIMPRKPKGIGTWPKNTALWLSVRLTMDCAFIIVSLRKFTTDWQIVKFG